MSVNIEEQWVPEPELREMPPRRFVRSDFPDHNRPNVVLFTSVSGAILVAGLLFFFFGLSGGRALMVWGGLGMSVVGLAGVLFFPFRARQHDARVERLVCYGIPAAARLLSADNISPDNVFGRSIRYQVSHPLTGEVIHRQANADDRALPKRIPSNVTALVDSESGEVDLYCVLPYRAIAKAVVPADPNFGLPTAVPEQAAPQMGTMAEVPMPEPVRKPKETAPKEPEKKRESYE